jgi:hypothetical protein
VHLQWLDALSYVQYTYVGISLNELTGLVITCTPAQLEAAGGTCATTSGEQVRGRAALGSRLRMMDAHLPVLTRKALGVMGIIVPPPQAGISSHAGLQPSVD